MSNEKIIMGVDTSNYTTSVALMTEDGTLLANIKRPLSVKAGERGLRQSDAVFAHIKNMPSAMAEAKGVLSGRVISAIGVSTRPRNIEGAYMPCFLAGVMAAESISASSSIPLYPFSHQCGHIMAAIYSSGRYDLLERDSFAAFHISGGTTEMLRVKPTCDAFESELIGGTADLNAGQIIDRVGVYMGIPFPAGPELEKLALKNERKLKNFSPKITEFKINLSGLENMAVKAYEETKDASYVSAFVLKYIGCSLSALADAYESRFGKSEFLFAGGVMSNSIIKNMILDKFNASFAEPILSSDNAVGIAELARRKFINQRDSND